MKLTILYFTIHFPQLKERKLLRSEHTSCSRNCETSFFADMTSNEFTFRPICRSPERIDITPSRPVCRQLFGPIDHSQMHSDLKRELTKMTKETTTRWNFDFENDQPLEGRYLWCSVRSKESKTEAFASSGSVCSRIEESNRSRDTAAAKPKEKFEGRPANLAPLKPELEFLANDKGLSARSSTTKKRPSSGKITDFLSKKKKQSSASSSPTCEPLPGRRRGRRQQVQSRLEGVLRTDNASASGSPA